MGYLCLQAVISDTSMSKRSTGALVGRRPSVGSPYRTPTRWEAGKKWMKRQQDGMAVDHHAHHPARGAAPVPFGRARAKHPGGAGRPCAACSRAASACAPSPSPVRAWLPMGVNVHDARGGNRDCPRRARGCAGVAQWSFSGSDRPAALATMCSDQPSPPAVSEVSWSLPAPRRAAHHLPCGKRHRCTQTRALPSFSRADGRCADARCC